MKLTSKRRDHLKSKIWINQLFLQGKVIYIYPFRLVYLELDASEYIGTQFLVSVPKRTFKLAVSRNAIKRRIGEAYRIHAVELKTCIDSLGKHLIMGFIYIGHTPLPYTMGADKINKILQELLSKYKDKKNEE